MAHQNESEVPTDSGVDHKDAGKSLPRDVETDFFCVLFRCPLIYPSRLWADTSVDNFTGKK